MRKEKRTRWTTERRLKKAKGNKGNEGKIGGREEVRKRLKKRELDKVNKEINK